MSNVKFDIYTKALALFSTAPQSTVTPTALSAALGADAPASKHAWFLKSLGFALTANKDGRNVVSYTMVAAPASAPAVKAAAVKKVPAPKVTKPARTASPAVPATAATAKKVAAAKPTAAKKKAVTPAVPVMTEADLSAAAASVDIADVNELDDRSDLPDFLR